MVMKLVGCALAYSFAAGAATACEHKAGETPFADYAKCRYASDAIVVVDLPEDGI